MQMAPQHVEVLLEVGHVNGAEVAKLLPEFRMLPIAPCVDAEGRRSALVGRSHQPFWFEAVVPDHNDLACLSRTIFELAWGGPDPSRAGLSVRMLGSNPIFVDDVPLARGEAAALGAGSRVAVTFQPPSTVVVMAWVVHCAAAQPVEPPGARLPAGGQLLAHVPVSLQTVPPDHTLDLGNCWQLECMYTAGLSAEALVAKPPHERAMSFVLQPNSPMIVGRAFQTELFESLLANDPERLTLISRSHVRLELAERTAEESESSLPTVRVTGLGQNATMVGAMLLHQGESIEMRNGDTLGFTAPLLAREASARSEFSCEVDSKTPSSAVGTVDLQADEAVAPFLTLRLVAPAPPAPPPACIMENPPSLTVVEERVHLGAKPCDLPPESTPHGPLLSSVSRETQGPCSNQPGSPAPALAQDFTATAVPQPAKAGAPAGRGGKQKPPPQNCTLS